MHEMALDYLAGLQALLLDGRARVIDFEFRVPPDSEINPAIGAVKVLKIAWIDDLEEVKWNKQKKKTI